MKVKAFGLFYNLHTNIWNEDARKNSLRITLSSMFHFVKQKSEERHTLAK